MFTEGIENRSIHDRFKFLLNTITSEKFLQMKGIGNEVPFFICPFNPKEIPQIEEMTENLIAQLKHIQISVAKINLILLLLFNNLLFIFLSAFVIITIFSINFKFPLLFQ